MCYLLLFAFIIGSNALKFKLTLLPEQQRCFYQVLTTQEKYAVEVLPYTNGTYELAIKHQENGEWLHSVFRKTNQPFEKMTLFKLASQESTYSFCLTNSGQEQLILKASFRWGLQLLDLRVLASETDQQMLSRETYWIDKEADKIIEIITSSKKQMSNKEELQSLMSYKFIGFAIFGILTVVIINVYFYFSLRKTFKERKMI